MGISSYRLIILIIAINLIIGIATGIADNPRLFNSEYVTGTINLGESYSTSLSGQTNVIQPDSYQQEGSFASAISMGWMLFTILIRGLNPFPFLTDTASNSFEAIVILGIMIFRIAMYIIIGLMIYDKLKNKKTD